MCRAQSSLPHSPMGLAAAPLPWSYGPYLRGSPTPPWHPIQLFSPGHTPACPQPCPTLGLSHLLYERWVRLTQSFSNIPVLPNKEKLVDRVALGLGTWSSASLTSQSSLRPLGMSLKYLAC